MIEIVPWGDGGGVASCPDDSELVKTGGPNVEADSRILAVTENTDVEVEGLTIMPGGTKDGGDGGTLLVVAGFGDSVGATVATVSSPLLLVLGSTVSPPMSVEVRYRPNSPDMLVMGHLVCSHCSLNMSMSPSNISSEF